MLHTITNIKIEKEQYVFFTVHNSSMIYACNAGGIAEKRCHTGTHINISEYADGTLVGRSVKGIKKVYKRPPVQNGDKVKMCFINDRKSALQTTWTWTEDGSRLK